MTATALDRLIQSHRSLIGSAESMEILGALREREELVFIVRSIITDLPQNRDWLDPAIEQTARAVLAKHGRGE